MRTVGGLSIALLLVAGVFGQQRGGYSNPQPYIRGGPGSVLYPGGTSRTMPSVTRTAPSVVYPGGGGQRLIIPGAPRDPSNPTGQNFRRGPGRGDGGFNRGGRGQGTVLIPYAYPVYVGGYGYTGYGYGGSYDGYAYDPNSLPAEQTPVQQQPNVIIVYPQVQQQTVAGEQAALPVPSTQSSTYEIQPAEAAPTLEPSHYLIAFKDHTIYAAVAYWVDGETLHYFTNGNTHNQVSLALVDRPLTERLNKESGTGFRLPPASQE